MNGLHLLSGKFNFLIFFVISAFIIVSFSSCGDDNSIVSAPAQLNGIGGRIVDTSGTPLSNVQIYCLFNSYYTPYYVSSVSSLNKPAGVDSFGFELKQNFPNPVRNSTYIRFSLPSALKVTISIVEKSTGIEKYNYSNDFDYGLYQYPLLNLVTDHQLSNGRYDIFLRAAQNGKIKYQANRTMFVISDSGKPNLYSSNSGYFMFNYNDACIGDTIIWTNNEYQDDTTLVYNYVNLLFRKEGYYSEIRQFVMYPNLMFNQDIIMTKKEN